MRKKHTEIFSVYSGNERKKSSKAEEYDTSKYILVKCDKIDCILHLFIKFYVMM
jgi:hypothetical protein